MISRFRSKTEVQKLHRHFFVSKFDTGILRKNTIILSQKIILWQTMALL